jgi:hypothetical protein
LGKKGDNMTTKIKQLVKDLKFLGNDGSNSGAPDSNLEKWYCDELKVYFISKKEAKTYYKEHLIQYTIDKINKSFGYERTAITQPTGKLCLLNQDGTIESYIKVSDLEIFI